MVNTTKSDVTYFNVTQQANVHMIFGNEITIARTYILCCIGMNKIKFFIMFLEI